MTFKEALSEGTGMLRKAGVPGADYDARALLLFASGMSIEKLAASYGAELPGAAMKQYLHLLQRRMSREPLQYIMGTAPFYGRDFLVQRGVLIPRFDTETLIEAVLPYLKPMMRILDLCTGSGCILLTLILEGPEGLEGTGSDISEEALYCARKNAEQLHAEAAFVKSDLFESIEGSFDLITANPPYIRSSVIGSLEAEVKEFEPLTALDGSEDGLEFYRRILREAGSHLRDGGRIALEIGFDQGSDVKSIMESEGFRDAAVLKDLAGLDRAVIGVWNYV